MGNELQEEEWRLGLQDGAGPGDDHENREAASGRDHYYYYSEQIVDATEVEIKEKEMYPLTASPFTPSCELTLWASSKGSNNSSGNDKELIA